MKALDEEALSRRLLSRQPQAEAWLERLRARLREQSQPSAFARLESNRCTACQLTIAAVRLERARAGEFIICPYCSRFLYYASD